MVLGRFIDVILAIAAATWLAMVGATGEVQAAAYDTSRLDRMPDFSQTDTRLGLPGGGSKYCVPVSTANVLVWLAEHRGYKNLLPVQGVTTIEKVASVATRLGSPEFMSTAPKGGTSLQRFVDGLNGFIVERGYRPSIEAYGPYEFQNVSRNYPGAPDMAQVRTDFARGKAVFVSLGFFRQTSSRNEFEWVGGHMTTMAGFGVDERGSTDRDVIILHDPDDGHSATVQRRYLHPERIRQLTGLLNNGRYRFALDDYLDVSAAFRLKPDYRAVIMHVFVLDM